MKRELQEVDDPNFDENQNVKSRENYPKETINILKKWLNENLKQPYPSESEKRMLSQQTGLHVAQISNWFINARRRIPGPENLIKRKKSLVRLDYFRPLIRMYLWKFTYPELKIQMIRLCTYLGK